MPEQQVHESAIWKPETFIDRASVMRLVDHNVTLLHKIVGGFLEESPRRLEEIEQAITDQDAWTLSWKAQVLQDAAKIFHSQATCAAAAALADIGKASDFSEAPAALERLEQTLLQLQCALRVYAAEFPAWNSY